MKKWTTLSTFCRFCVTKISFFDVKKWTTLSTFCRFCVTKISFLGLLCDQNFLFWDNRVTILCNQNFMVKLSMDSFLAEHLCTNLQLINYVDHLDWVLSIV